MRHVIVGAGPAAISAIETIRQSESDRSSITLISDEPAHARMALPYWLSGKIGRADTHTADAAWFERHGIDARIGARALSVDVEKKVLALDSGESVAYDRLLIATGSTPAVPSIPGCDLDRVMPLWRLEHVAALLEATADCGRPRVVFIGAGFVSMILVGALMKADWDVVVIEQAPHILPRMLDPAAAACAERFLGSRGVELHVGCTARAIEADGAKRLVHLSDGGRIEADAVVLATGVRPALAWLGKTPIAVGDGILVDAHMQTSVPDVYAAGDVAQGPVLGSDIRAVHAIQPTATDHGRIAGANMAGHRVAYPGSLLMNVVDLGGLQCVAYGDALEDTGDDVVTEDADRSTYRRLVFRSDHLVGATLVGRPGEVGQLNDVGMLKGFLQIRPSLGSWKAFLKAHPFDLRRPYVALGIPEALLNWTLIGRPSLPRDYPADAATAASQRTATRAHRLLVEKAVPEA